MVTIQELKQRLLDDAQNFENLAHQLILRAAEHRAIAATVEPPAPPVETKTA